MRTYRSGGELFDTIQLTDGTSTLLTNPDHVVGVLYDPVRRVVLIETDQGLETAELGDWIVKAPNGRLSRVGDEAFRLLFEPVD
jgi:hypothetical protein